MAKNFMEKVRKRLSSVGQFRDGMTNAGLEMVELITTPGPGKKLATEKQPTFRDVTTGFAAKSRLKNECGNSILMTPPYPDLGSASD